MNTAVRFASRSGNTEKVAQAIAKGAGCAAKPVSVPVTEPADVLFLGGSLYAGGIDKELETFIAGLSEATVKKVVVFGTAAGPKSILPIVQGLLTGKNIAVAPEFFQCRGKFLLANRGRPNSDDFSAAEAFARRILQ